jgi:hypothetical protein
MSYKKLHVPHPFPEALPSGSGWVVEEMHPGEPAATTSVVNKRMRVPLKVRQQERNTRAHEMGHAAWSPKDEPGKIAKRNKISVRSLQCAEDMRVHLALSDSGVDLSAGLQTPDGWDQVAASMQEMIDNGNVEEAIQSAIYFSVASLGTGDALRFLAAVPKSIKESVERTVDRAWEIMVRNNYDIPRPWKRTIAVARYIDSVLPVKQPPKLSTDQQLPEIHTKSELEELARKIKNGEIELSPEDKRKPEHTTNPDTTWGDMTIETPPRRETAEMRRVAPVTRATETGTRIRTLHRLRTDGKIFGYRAKQAGGTCLIDTSGSMSLKHEDIFDMVSKAPHATVAVYAGDRITGKLRILVKGGRAVEKEKMVRPDRGNNIIDGPALRWLAHQPAPRVWVSDGLVTGCHARKNAKLYMDRDRLLVAGRIKRVADVPAAISFFEEIGGRRRRLKA